MPTGLTAMLTKRLRTVLAKTLLSTMLSTMLSITTVNNAVNGCQESWPTMQQSKSRVLPPSAPRFVVRRLARRVADGRWVQRWARTGWPTRLRGAAGAGGCSSGSFPHAGLLASCMRIRTNSPTPSSIRMFMTKVSACSVLSGVKLA